jgi:hypothetical protein
MLSMGPPQHIPTCTKASSAGYRRGAGWLAAAAEVGERRDQRVMGHSWCRSDGKGCRLKGADVVGSGRENTGSSV